MAHNRGGESVMGESVPEAPRWSVAPYFIVDDVDALAAEFASRGVTLARKICDQPYGCRDFDVLDCNGYRLCFGQDVTA